MRRGNQTPTFSWCAPYEQSEGQYAIAMANAYGMAPHPWQQTVLNDWLALDDDGKLLNSLCLLPVPRQNGKTGCCDPRETWGLVHRGEWILHTAQEYQTAKKAFDRLRMKFGERKNDPMARYPELNALVKRYTTSANQMVLDLTNGGHIEFRTRGSNDDVGRGGTFDLVVVDEAQSYTDAQDAALSPLNSAAPTGSPQTIMMGTVPSPTSAYKGEKFASIRKSLHDDPYVGACIHEWSVDTVGDVSDVDRWYETNPSLGYQLLESALLADSRKMSPDTFAREHLGWWPKTGLAQHVINADEWEACKTDVPPADGVMVYAVKFAPDGSAAALAVCVKPSDGTPYVEVITSKSLAHGIGWLVDWLVERQGNAANIVIDGRSYAETLVDKLLLAKVPRKALVVPTSRDMAAACATMLNAVKEEGVQHYGQPGLDASAVLSIRRDIGRDGGFGFESTPNADASLIEACSLALWQALRTKRNPKRKQRVG